MPDRLGEKHFGKETQEGGNGCHRQPHGTPVLGGGKQGTGLEKDARYGSIGERGNARRDWSNLSDVKTGYAGLC